MLSREERSRLIEKIRILPEQIEGLVSGLSDEELRMHFLPGEWNVAQNVHHLADSHMNSFIRLKLMLTEDEPTLKPYNQDLWAVMVDGDNLDVLDSIRLLQGLHRRWVTLFDNLQESEWSRSGIHPEIGKITVEDLLRGYAAHGEAHNDQIRRTLAAQT
jgi:hypothetical protein